MWLKPAGTLAAQRLREMQDSKVRNNCRWREHFISTSVVRSQLGCCERMLWFLEGSDGGSVFRTVWG
jgi:hypothetical protein